ncbi:hypothetical protein EI94DRAFT_1739875 [Lactarius quietus]|nr:hypothetical protein EI94DRAFT_1739875 [Lactarius quietus]
MLAEIKEAPKHYTDAKKQALLRDGYRCVVTGIYDSNVDLVQDLNVTEEEKRAAGGEVFTECAHIVPDSTYFNVADPSDKKEYSASVLAVLKRFGYDVGAINGEKVHSLYNVMTMEHNAHDLFDRLNLWFKRRVRTTKLLLPVRENVMFTTPDPLKSLALHAACAQVAHLSGAGEYVDHILRDMEDICVLAHDGTSSEVLHHALMTLGPQAISV